MTGSIMLRPAVTAQVTSMRCRFRSGTWAASRSRYFRPRTQRRKRYHEQREERLPQGPGHRHADRIEDPRQHAAALDGMAAGAVLKAARRRKSIARAGSAPSAALR